MNEIAKGILQAEIISTLIGGVLIVVGCVLYYIAQRLYDSYKKKKRQKEYEERIKILKGEKR